MFTNSFRRIAISPTTTAISFFVDIINGNCHKVTLPELYSLFCLDSKDLYTACFLRDAFLEEKGFRENSENETCQGSSNELYQGSTNDQ